MTQWTKIEEPPSMAMATKETERSSCAAKMLIVKMTVMQANDRPVAFLVIFGPMGTSLCSSQL